MNHQSTITVKQSESPMEVRQTYNTALSPIHDIFPDESKGKHQLARNCSTACPSLHVQTESLGSPSLQRASSFRSQKSSSTPEPDSPVSYSSHRQYPKTTFSRSSTFCTSLYSFSTGTETHRQLHSLPFLPHPPKCNQTIPVIHSSESPLPLIGDLSNQFAEKSPGYLTKECLNFSEDDTDGTFNGATYGSNSLTLTEQLELQYLSQELDIAITDNTENPRIDEIYEAHQVSSGPTDASKCNQNHLPPLVPPVDGQSHSCQPSPVTEASHKPRMRWTPELHECFLEAVKKLDGAEKATPKGILKLMNVDGLTIYHVKSHLQKYRLAKYVPETREDKEISNSEEKEKKATSDINDGDAQPKRGMQVTETLRMQMEVQKQLHEQLEVQRALQLRIEEHARYLQKILAEQEKASGSFVSTSSTSLLTESQAASELGPLPILADSFSEQATSEASSSKQEGIECTKVEQLAGQKRPRHEAKLEPSRLESPEQ